MAANEIKKIAAIMMNRKRLVRIVNPPFSDISVNEIDAGHLPAPNQTVIEGEAAEHISIPIQDRQLLYVSPPLHSSLFIPLCVF
jgi:hypothetical protein